MSPCSPSPSESWVEGPHSSFHSCPPSPSPDLGAPVCLPPPAQSLPSSQSVCRVGGASAMCVFWGDCCREELGRARNAREGWGQVRQPESHSVCTGSLRQVRVGQLARRRSCGPSLLPRSFMGIFRAAVPLTVAGTHVAAESRRAG